MAAPGTGLVQYSGLNWEFLLSWWHLGAPAPRKCHWECVKMISVPELIARSCVGTMKAPVSVFLPPLSLLCWYFSEFQPVQRLTSSYSVVLGQGWISWHVQHSCILCFPCSTAPALHLQWHFLGINKDTKPGEMASGCTRGCSGWISGKNSSLKSDWNMCSSGQGSAGITSLEMLKKGADLAVCDLFLWPWRSCLKLGLMILEVFSILSDCTMVRSQFWQYLLMSMGIALLWNCACRQQQTHEQQHQGITAW